MEKHIEKLTPGLRYELRFTVEHRHSAAALGSGGLELLSTPYLIAMMEGASFYSVEDALGEAYTTVGTSVEMQHIAATPIGSQVVAIAELVEIDGRRLRFRVEAYDETDRIGEGYHERFVIDKNKFLAKLADKALRIASEKAAGGDR